MYNISDFILFVAEPYTTAVRAVVSQFQDDQLRHLERRCPGENRTRPKNRKSSNHTRFQIFRFGQLYMQRIKYTTSLYTRLCLRR